MSALPAQTVAGRTRALGVQTALVLALAACSPTPSPSGTVEDPVTVAAQANAIRFVDVTRSWGLDFRHDAGFSAEKHLPETMGAGAALCDVDGDGWIDLYLVQGGPLPLTPDRSAAPPNRLFRNRAGERFEDITARSGDAAQRGYGMGAIAGDVDSDGKVDLFVTNLGPDVLLLGDGSGRFDDRTDRTDLADPRWTAGAAFFDAEGDGDLDLYVTAYLEVDLADPPWCGERREGWRSYCHPDQFSGLADRFYRNDGSGRFRDATAQAGLSDNAGKGLGVIAVDVDDDGQLDLYIANDSVENRLWRNRGDGTFEDLTLLSGTGVNGAGATEAGMGLAAGDVFGSGRLDLYVTNFDDESNTLYRNEGGGLFTDVTARALLDAPTRLPVGFGVVLADLDLDGDLDLAVANGHIIDNIELYHDGKSWAQQALLLVNLGDGRFEDASATSGDLTAQPRVGRGLYAGDFDGDGKLDLVFTTCGGPALLLHNRSAGPAGLELIGLPEHTRVELVRPDGSRLTRMSGPAPSYLGGDAPGLWLEARAAAAGVLRVRPPGKDWAELAFEGEPGPGLWRAVRAGAGWSAQRVGR